MRKPFQLLVVWVILFVAVSAGAEPGATPTNGNPRVTLHLEQVTAGEAVEALGRASGISFRYSQGISDAVGKAGFDWKEVPLATAMREVSERLGVFFQRHDRGSYGAGPALGGRGRPQFLATADQTGIRICVCRTRLVTEQTASLNGHPQRDRSAAKVEFLVQWPGEEGERIRTLTHLVAKDDRGNILTTGVWGEGGIDRPARFPDEWADEFDFPGCDPQARKLLWVEGTLEASGPTRWHELRIPLAGSALPAAFDGDSLHVDLNRVAQSEDAGRWTLESEFFTRNPPRPRSTTFRLLKQDEPAVRVTPIGLSGKEYGFQFTQRRVTADRTYWRCRARELPEKIVALHLTAEERSDPQPIASFRLENVPLPSGAGAPPQTPAANVPHAAGPEHAFFDPAGGWLTVPVAPLPRHKGAAATANVAFGLARVGVSEPATLHWIEVPLQADGTARLDHLRPGKYRVRCRFHALSGTLTSPVGDKSSAEAIVEVRAGRGTVLPALPGEGGR